VKAGVLKHIKPAITHQQDYPNQMNAPSNEDAEDEEQADEVLLDEDGETMEAEEAAGGSIQPTQAGCCCCSCW
jgi:hypothetical protein